MLIVDEFRTNLNLARKSKMLQYTLKSFGVSPVRNEEAYVQRVINMPVTSEEFAELNGIVKYIGVTEQFIDVIETFNYEADRWDTPAGFKRALELYPEGVLRVDLIRDISYDKNGELRPTNVLFSADSANPYEVAPISPLLANLTCNPGIIYDLFINNPEANVGNKFKNRDEVMAELAKILGPGVDISVELNNPFEKDFGKILEESEKFKEMFSKYRVVMKVPHTGAVTPNNVHQLLTGDKKLAQNYKQVSTENGFLSHNLALKLHENGYRVNYTLMFEAFQTQLALQARPYFINTFLRQRLGQSESIQRYISAYKATKDEQFLKDLKQYFYSTDYYNLEDLESVSLSEALQFGEDILEYRHFNDPEGSDGLDQMRHNLRCLRNSNMPDTRLIVCSMEGPKNYPDLDKLMAEPEFQDMHHKVVITAEPNYLARFTSTNQVITYQRRFMNAANGQQ